MWAALFLLPPGLFATRTAAWIIRSPYCRLDYLLPVLPPGLSASLTAAIIICYIAAGFIRTQAGRASPKWAYSEKPCRSLYDIIVTIQQVHAFTACTVRK